MRTLLLLLLSLSLSLLLPLPSACLFADPLSLASLFWAEAEVADGLREGLNPGGLFHDHPDLGGMVERYYTYTSPPLHPDQHTVRAAICLFLYYIAFSLATAKQLFFF